MYPVDTALPHPATMDLSRALPWTYLKIICFKLNSIQTIDSSLVIIVIITYMHVHVVIITCACICHSRQLLFLRKSDCLGCAVLLCLICLFDFACFFLSSLIKNMYNVHVCMHVHIHIPYVLHAFHLQDSNYKKCCLQYSHFQQLLPSLERLDLSYNCIDKIENLTVRPSTCTCTCRCILYICLFDLTCFFLPSFS